MPRELRCPAPGRLEWREYDEPEPAGRQVLVRSRQGAAKHGTEMASFKGYAAHRGAMDPEHKVFTHRPPQRPGGGMVGNMTVGEVVRTGPEVQGLAAGDRVLLYGGFRQSHLCDEGRCWKIPAELSWKSAVCLDPADFALGAIRDGHVRVGDAVGIFGMGAIGLMAVQIAKAAGAAPVIACEPLPARRAAAEKVGADLVLDPASCDAGLEMKKATDKRGLDVAIEYSGSERALQAALRAVAYGGTVVAGAFPPPYPAGLDLGAEAHINVPNLVFSRSCSEPNRDHPRWDERRIQQVCLEMLIDGSISGEDVVAPVARFEELLEAYPKIATEPDTYIKLGVEYP